MGKRYNTLLLTIIVALMLIGSWVLGERRGARQATAIAATGLSSAEAQSIIEQLQTSLFDSQSELEGARLSLETALVRAQVTERQLDEQLRKGIADSRDLILYRRIETSDASRGVEVDSVEWRTTEPSTLKLVLLQWQGRDRVSGQLQISLNFEQAGATDIGPNSGFDSSTVTVDLESVTFDFRFFQRFNVRLPSEIGELSAGNSINQTPYSVVFTITPSDGPTKASETVILWTDIEQ